MKMSQEQLLGILRHVLTFAGGIAVAQGKIDNATVETIIGAVVTLGGAVWSVRTKRAK